MENITRLLRVYGFWSRPNGTNNKWLARALNLLYTTWILLPGFYFIYRWRSDFFLVMRPMLELMVMVKSILQAIATLKYRKLQEKVHNDMQSAIAKASTDPNNDIQVVLRRMEYFTDMFFRIFFGFETVATSAYCFMPHLVTIAKYAITGVVPPLPGMFEVE